MGRVPKRIVEERASIIKTWGSLLGSQRIKQDDIAGEVLYATALTYFSELDSFNEIISKNTRTYVIRHPSEAIVTATLQTSYLFWSPYYVKSKGMNIDVDRDIYSAFSIDGTRANEKAFMMSSGTIGSALEHAIFEQLYNVSSVSTIKILNVASTQGIPIFSINRSNVGEVLPKLELSPSVKDAIINAVNSGKVVIAPQREITHYNWTGAGWIVLDPETGAGAYMISGGLAGGSWSEETFETERGWATWLAYDASILEFMVRLDIEFLKAGELPEEKLAKYVKLSFKLKVFGFVVSVLPNVVIDIINGEYAMAGIDFAMGLIFTTIFSAYSGLLLEIFGLAAAIFGIWGVLLFGILALTLAVAMLILLIKIQEALRTIIRYELYGGT